MRFNIRSLFFAVLLLALTLGVLSYRASQQRRMARQLLEHDLVAIQFTDGKYCESILAAQEPNHFFQAIDVVYLDVPRSETDGVIPLLKDLPWLRRIVIRYQGQDFDEYKKQKQEIQDAINRQEQEIREALPDTEILTFSTVVDYSG